MAEIKPFKAWRYNSHLSQNIESLTAPLFDVVTAKQREKFYGNPHNSIHLSVPNSTSPAESALDRLKKWKEKGIVIRDEKPSIYVYYQYFTLSGNDKTFCRKGFIINIKITDWDENVILRHESTMPFSVSDRLELLKKTQLNVSPTHGLFTDPEKEIEILLDKSIQNPIYETEDYQGVKDVLSIIDDLEEIKKIQSIISDKQIILADGHHRYEGSLNYMKHMKVENPMHDGTEGYNYHMMYMTNTEADDLRILPTHRLINGIEGFSKEDFLENLAKDFFIVAIENAADTNEIIQGKKWTFGLLVGEDAFKITLRPERFSEITWQFPKVIKQLDLTVMHYFIFEKILGIKGRKQVNTQKIEFQRNFTECIKRVIKDEAQFALITKDISIEDVKQTCYSGYTMPQKSTYFYPKVISGFLFSSIKKDEFDS